MAVKIRLARHGAHKAPYYRIVVADSRARRDGRYIEQVGTYNPLTEPKKVTMDLEKIDGWIAQGAKPTETVARLLIAPLVEFPDEVEVTSTETEDGSTLIEVSVNPEDVGRVIGRQGRIIKAIRTLSRAAGSRHDLRIEVELID